MTEKIIIYISPGQPKVNDPTLLVGKKGFGSWSTRFARNLQKQSSEYRTEVWSMYDSKKFPDSHGEVFTYEGDTITFRLFPGRPFGTKYISLPLIRELRRRIGRREKILVHVQSIHGLIPYSLGLFCRKLPLVGQQRGPNSPPMWRFKFERKPYYLLLSVVNHFALHGFDFIFASSIGETEYIKEKLGSDRVMNLKGGGFEFEKNVPKQKGEARKELGLPIDEKIIIHIGRFNKLKGIDVIIAVYKILKEKRDDVKLIFIGGNMNQPLYNEVINSGAIVKGYIPKEDVIKYLNATDVHLLPTESKEWIPFGDIPTAIIESLSMNQPVVTPMLIHFAGTEEERKKLGFMANDREDVLKAVEYIFDHLEKYNNTRPVMKKYYNWERIINNNIKVYEELFRRYYEV